MNEFGLKLKEVRTRRNLTQTQLAEMCGLSFQWVSLYETGRRKPAFEQLKQLAIGLSVSADYLLGINKEE